MIVGNLSLMSDGMIISIFIGFGGMIQYNIYYVYQRRGAAAFPRQGAKHHEYHPLHCCLPPAPAQGTIGIVAPIAVTGLPVVFGPGGGGP